MALWTATTGPRIRGERQILALAGLTAAYLAAMLWFSRFHLLDDALIHLRFAELLIEHGFFTADGRAASFGTSSPAFVLLAAMLHALAPSDFTTKILSVGFYLAFVVGLGALALRSNGSARTGWLLLLALALTPMALRWLTDGMETSFAAAIALLLGIATARVRTAAVLPALALFALGMAAVLTRIEMTLLVALAALAITLRAGAGGSRGLPHDAMCGMPLALGGVVALMLIWLMFGAVLPDTAIAKATGKAAPANSLAAIAISLAGALGFGAGLIALWLAGFGNRLHALARNDWTSYAIAAVPNLALLVLWALISVRGQYVQGIRYILPALIFMIAANTAMSRTSETGLPWLRGISASRLVKARLALYVAVIGFEFTKFQAIVDGRTAAFLEMRDMNLEGLEGESGIAWDVGYLMYFTKAQICDVSGLINGRRAASSTESTRLEDCLKRDIEFVFVTPENATRLIGKSGSRFVDWPICGHYVFRNVSDTAPHYLAVAPDRAAQICPQQYDGRPLKQAALRTS
jgi:hypothetical protein